MGENIEREIQTVRFNSVGIPIVDKAARESINEIMSGVERLSMLPDKVEEIQSSIGNMATKNDITELINRLNAIPQFIIDDTGMITGYKTIAGGTTIFPVGGSGSLPMKTLFCDGIFENEDICKISVHGGSVIGHQIVCNARGSGVFSIMNTVKNAQILIQGTPSVSIQYGIGNNNLSLPTVITAGTNRGSFVNGGTASMISISPTTTYPAWFSGLMENGTYTIDYIGCWIPKV